MTQGFLAKDNDGDWVPLTGFTSSHPIPLKSSVTKQAHMNERLRKTEVLYAFQHVLEPALTLNLRVLVYMHYNSSVS